MESAFASVPRHAVLTVINCRKIRDDLAAQCDNGTDKIKQLMDATTALHDAEKELADYAIDDIQQ